MQIDWENYGRDRYGDDTGGSNSYHYQSNYQVHRGEYVSGNTVRKLYAMPERKPERREVRPPKRVPKRHPERKPVKMPGISRRGFAFVGVMLCSVILLSFMYLTTKNTVAKQKSQIISLQSEIAEMKEQNDEMQQNIINSVDLAKIYKTATEKLKMVHAGKNQIYTYSNKKSNMVKQYANIPGVDD